MHQKPIKSTQIQYFFKNNGEFMSFYERTDVTDQLANGYLLFCIVDSFYSFVNMPTLI